MSSSTKKQEQDDAKVPEDTKSKSQVRRVRPARLKHTVLGLPAAGQMPPDLEKLKAGILAQKAQMQAAAAEAEVEDEQPEPEQRSQPVRRRRRNPLVSEASMIVLIIIAAVAAYLYLNR